MIWLYIKELAGKDLDISTILKFILYGLPKLMPLVLPLTILLASIMVFGSFAENYEFAAMKSTGISLQRAMASLSVFIVVLSFVTFWFSNNVIPWGEYNFFNLRKNLAKVKPSMAIAEGQFNEIESTAYNIKVEKKTGDKGQFLEKVIIHKKSADGLRNATTITAETGELVASETSNILKLILHDGNFYEDVYPKKINDRKKQPFAKSAFKTYTMNIDLSNLNKVDIDDKSYDNKYSMLNVSELDYAIDSLTRQHDDNMAQFNTVLYQRTNLKKIIRPIRSLEEPLIQEDIYEEPIALNTEELAQKRIPNDSIYDGNILDLFGNKKKSQFVTAAINNINNTKQLIENKIKTVENNTKWFNRHVIAFHEKLALPFACIILFFVGAPLGALIRKGGIGLPLVIAILLFLTYHFIGIFALNSAKNGSFNPVLASWFSTLIMLPLSVYLTKKATADRSLFETEGVLEPLKKLFGISKTIKIDSSVFESHTNEFSTLEGYTDKELIKIIKSYRQFGYSRTYRNTAVSILNARGISDQQLKFSGNFNNQFLEEGIRLKYKLDEDSKLALVLYLISFPLILAGLILKNNTFPRLGMVFFIVGIAVGLIYILALIRSFVSSSNLNKHLKKDTGINAILYLLFGLPLYFVFYVFQKKSASTALYLNPIKKSANSTKSQIEYNVKLAKPHIKNYNAYSIYAITLYSFTVVVFILYFVFRNNKLPSLASAAIELSAIALILFVIYYIKSIINLMQVYNNGNLKDDRPNSLIVMAGMPLYFITFFVFKRKLNVAIGQ